jgi:CheY-like chemotaxis protein
MLGHAELLLGNPDLPESGRADLERIRGGAEHAAALTHQLLAFARRQVLRPRPVDLNQLVGELDRMLRRLLMESIEIRLHLAPDLATVSADPTQLSQVLLNLAVNARDAMPNGGVLTIETGNAHLDETFGQRHLGVKPGRYVTLVVTDTGIGMDEATRSHLFEPFFTTKGPGKGTGLGLSTAYGIVRQSGGSIWVYSEPGRGASFRIYLPAIERSAVVDVPKAAPVRASPGHETVLVVEDSPPVRQLTANRLRSAGYRVLEAASPAEAEQVSVDYPDEIHLLLTDVIMPGLSGPELSTRLTRSRPALRVLFMSGYTEVGVMPDSLAGAGFLQKPFSGATLLRQIRELLDYHAPG